jgi:hypothetical protein
MEGLGGPQGMRSLNTYDYVPGGGDAGRVGGGTYTNPRGDGNRDPTIQVGMFVIDCTVVALKTVTLLAAIRTGL